MLIAQGWMSQMPLNPYTQAFLREIDSYCAQAMQVVTEPEVDPIPQQYWLSVRMLIEWLYKLRPFALGCLTPNVKRRRISFKRPDHEKDIE